MSGMNHDANAAALFWLIASLRGTADITSLVADNISTLPFNEQIVYPAVGLSFLRSSTYQEVNGEPHLIYVFWNTLAIAPAINVGSLAPVVYALNHTLKNMFNGADPHTPHGLISSCTFIQPVYYTELDKEHVNWTHSGSLWQIGVTRDPAQVDP
jgi:hypothetical protein